MNPAPSVILFSVLSGAGFGLMVFLGLWPALPAGLCAFAAWGLAYGLAVGGLLASTAHLGNPQRALLAFTQWRTSWLSREAWAAVATLLVMAPLALSDWLGLGWPRAIGALGAVLALATVLTTSMIYAQIKAVPRWHHWLTLVYFQAFALTGGAILSGHRWIALALLVVLTAVLGAIWRIGDGAFARAGQTLGTATGLGAIGEVTVFEQAHTAGNYLLREMIFVVGRKHAAKVRVLALSFACALPMLLLLLPFWPAAVLAALSHIVGALAARWLFFAEAEHVVGLYYGMR
jgi:sulfite dehydrogenase (quinone) subunit SoeC